MDPSDDVIAAELAVVVAPSLRRTPDELGPWTTELLARPTVADLATVGIWRIRGSDWSSVLKVLAHAEGGGGAWSSHPEMSHPFYWRREADAFESPLLAGLRGGLRAPYPHGVVDRRDGTVAVWMEDIAGDPGSGWPLTRYGLAARHLGQLQGALAGAPTLVVDGLAEPWLSRDWLRVYVQRRAAGCAILDDPDVWRHPGVRSLVPVERAEGFRALWADRGRHLEVVDTFPRTLCQLDFHPRNVFDVRGETVVIDWAFAGVGAVGEDVGTLLVNAVADFHLAPDQLPDLLDTLVDGYATGLAEGGCALPVEAVRRAVAAGATAKYGWLVPHLLEAIVRGRATLNGRPLTEGAASWVAAGLLLLDLAPIALDA